MHSYELNALNRSRAEYTQQENSQITYTVNWAAFLDGDNIASSTWSTEDGGLTIANESNSTTTASARLSGDPGRYRAVNKVTTALGDVHERYIDIVVRDNSSGYAFDYGLVTDNAWR